MIKYIISMAAALCAAALLCLWLSAPAGPLLANTPFGGIVLDSRGGISRLALASDSRYRLFSPLDKIAPSAVDAVINYEDRYFYSHPGVNAISLLRGAISLVSGTRRMGGSTITMQTARLLYGLETTSIAGKLKQIWLALGLELKHSKGEILEAYLNLAPYGGNVEGIEAASRIYFHKAAAMLTKSESQALAIVPQNPVARQPGIGKAFEAARLKYSDAKAPLKVYGKADLPFQSPHLAMELLAKDPNRQWQTAIEPDLQKMLERHLAQYAARGRKAGLNNAAALLLRASDMRLLASAGSASYHNAAISGQIDGTRARRSPGSTLKPFIYALALDEGLIHPWTILADSPKSFGGYDPENFDRSFRGPVPAHEALKASRNLPAIALAERLAEPGLYGFLRSAKVELPKGPDHYGLALALGGAEISMRELASLYAMLANNGIWRPLRVALDEPLQPGARLLSPEAAWLALEMLARPEARLANGARIYYKTGTSNGLRDAWAAGIIGGYVLIAWAGNFDNSPNPMLVGASAALPLFEEMALSLGAMRRIEDRAALPPGHLNLAQARICPSTGDLYKGQCSSPVSAWIIPGVSPTRDSGISRKILVDRATGKRACDPGDTVEMWHEFWPTDMKMIFAQAGIYKPDAPEWLEQCKGGPELAGNGPRIMLPKRNVVYRRRQEDKSFRLPLQAALDSGAGSAHWYAGHSYIGSSNAGEILMWDAPAGTQELRVVDSQGRMAKRECQIVLTR